MAVPAAVKPVNAMFRGPIEALAPLAVKPAKPIVRGTIGVAVPVAVNPPKVIVRGPGLGEAGEVIGACLGPASRAGAEVGASTAMAPGVTV